MEEDGEDESLAFFPLLCRSWRPLSHEDEDDVVSLPDD